uniref:Uncharacterized protein n=1 Tax=Anguilla anguilla TaxID=7936 RepID=A0A0E9T6J0_ANGAN
MIEGVRRKSTVGQMEQNPSVASVPTALRSTGQKNRTHQY